MTASTCNLPMLICRFSSLLATDDDSGSSNYNIKPCQNLITTTLMSEWQWTPLYLVKSEYGVTRAIIEIIMCMYVCCITCPRSGPNWRDLRELLGQQRDPHMLPAALTTERSIPSCWSLGDGIRTPPLCRIHGSWMSTLDGGRGWMMMFI